jgi:hypothetical protein
MYGQYYIRAASTLDGKRVKKDPAFRKTMQYAALLAKASRIGSIVYNELPLHKKKHTLYRKLTGEAMIWLKYQWTEEDIIAYLLQHYIQQPVTVRSTGSVSLRPSYGRKTQRIKRDRRRKKPIREQVCKTRSLFSVNYYQRLHQKLRRKVNEEIDSYSWAE